jgi:hypothetical protein
MRDCLKRETAALELSGETPNEVALAVVSQCEIEITAFVSANARPSEVDAQIKLVEAARIPLIRADVVVIRAKRNGAKIP